MKAHRHWRYEIGAAALVGVLIAIFVFRYSYKSAASREVADTAASKSPSNLKPGGTTQAVNAKTPSSSENQVVAAFDMKHEFVSRVGGQAVDYPGAFAKASIVADGKKYDLTPNQLGYFERVNVGPKSVSQVQVAFPQGQKGDPVAIVVEDGGHLDEGQMSSVVTLDDQKNVRFKFMTTDSAGIYRIALHNGSDVKVVNFWVGQEPQVRE